MRTQSKRFIVEMKRGTSRSAFVSHDVAADRFSSAELALFGAPQQQSPASKKAEAAPPQGRILRSLIEPPPPVVEMPEAPRRGRKPGSKNKPKPVPQPHAEGHNIPTITTLSAEARAFVERPSIRIPGSPSTPASTAEVFQAIEPAPVASIAPALERPRLRDRSIIIRRYVLGVEPRPGDAGFGRARRASKGAN